MRRLLPEGFLTIRQAAERLAAAMYGGVPDRPEVASLRRLGGSQPSMRQLWRFGRQLTGRGYKPLQLALAERAH
jgi:hypothetical protein